MKYAIQIYQEGGYPNNYPYLFDLDKNGMPIRMVTFEAKSLGQAISLMSSPKFCRNLGIPEDLFFEQYKLKEL